MAGHCLRWLVLWSKVGSSSNLTCIWGMKAPLYRFPCGCNGIQSRIIQHFFGQLQTQTILQIEIYKIKWPSLSSLIQPSMMLMCGWRKCWKQYKGALTQSHRSVKHEIIKSRKFLDLHVHAFFFLMLRVKTQKGHDANNEDDYITKCRLTYRTPTPVVQIMTLDLSKIYFARISMKNLPSCPTTRPLGQGLHDPSFAVCHVHLTTRHCIHLSLGHVIQN
jgi:hypothetical protein